MLARYTLGLTSALVVAASISSCSGRSTSQQQPDRVAVDIATATYAAASGHQNCQSDTFVPHNLPFVAATRSRVPSLADATGTGVTAADLNDDGLIDLVLPSLVGDTSIWWNQGGLEFQPTVLASGRFRQALVVDLNADGYDDIVLTTGVGPLQAYVQNDSAVTTVPSFERVELRTNSTVAYSASVGDIEGDGGVDIVTSSYNAELTMARDARVLNGVDIGTTRISPAARSAGQPIGDGELAVDHTLLTTSSQGLVTMVADIDGDGWQDVWVGNDLGTPDRLWTGSAHGLTATELFDTTTLSTMSLDIADIDNDGQSELFATDMAPMAGEDTTDDNAAAQWQEIREDITAATNDDIQIAANVLYDEDEGWADTASAWGVEASGWSWSGAFGDLDNDGNTDLFVGNGMHADGLFRPEVDAELVEPNQAFRNTGTSFEPMPSWRLDAASQARGAALVDLDNDGDLDVAIAPVGSRAVVYENQLCSGASASLLLDWKNVTNADALGALVTVTLEGVSQAHQVTSNSGYLSSRSTRIHIGLGDADTDAARVSAAIVWPDGQQSTVELQPGSLTTVTRDEPPKNRTTEP